MINIKFKVTPAQEETILLRVKENGFDEISTYVKVMAIKTQRFTLTPAGAPKEEATLEIEFDVSESQKKMIEENVKESECEDLTTYLQYVAMHGVVSASIEVRSTGNLDSMLERIKKSRNL